MNFEYFKNQKWLLQAVRLEKVDEINGVISLLFSWVMVLYMSQKVRFFVILGWIQQEI